MWDSQTIYKKVTVSADKYGHRNPQQFKQLTFCIAQSAPQDAYDGLIRIFTEASSNASNRQELAGRLLFKVNPTAQFDVKRILEASLEFYDLSVEELPFYLVSQAGLEKVIDEADKISETQLTERQTRALNTIKYWLRNYKTGIKPKV